MSNTDITNLQISDTFQIWVNKTNQLIDLANENTILVGPGSGYTITGNSTLIGSFTSTNLSANTVVANTVSVETITRKDNIGNQIIVGSPVRINTNVSDAFYLKSTSGNSVISLENSGGSIWTLRHTNSASSASLIIGRPGAEQVRITGSGTVTATQFSGNGSLLTSLNANNITSGTLSSNRIGNLDASKITTGTLSVDRIPNLNANKITSGTISNDRLPSSATRNEIGESQIANGTSTTQGFITGRRFKSGFDSNVLSSNDIVRTSGTQTINGNKNFIDYVSFESNVGTDFIKDPGKDRIRIAPADIGSQNRIVTITTPSGGLTSASNTLTLANGNTTLVPGIMVPTSRRILTGTGISITGNGDLSQNRTISAVIANEAEAINGTDVETLMNPLRTRQAMDARQLGSNQAWQTVTREHNTSYTNDTGRPIMVSFSGAGNSVTGGTPMFQVSSDGNTWISVAHQQGALNHTTVIVPPNWRYRAVNTPNNNQWAELR
jgi:hypothetical protein